MKLLTIGLVFSAAVIAQQQPPGQKPSTPDVKTPAAATSVGAKPELSDKQKLAVTQSHDSFLSATNAWKDSPEYQASLQTETYKQLLAAQARFQQVWQAAIQVCGGRINPDLTCGDPAPSTPQVQPQNKK